LGRGWKKSLSLAEEPAHDHQTRGGKGPKGVKRFKNPAAKYCTDRPKETQENIHTKGGIAGKEGLLTRAQKELTISKKTEKTARAGLNHRSNLSAQSKKE